MTTFATMLFSAEMMDRWANGFISGGLKGAAIGIVVAIIAKASRSGS